jgi:alkylhydroperoxidase family enzyme
MPYVSSIDQPRGLLQRYAWRFSRRKFGRVVDPVRVAAHHNGVLMASGAVETVVEKRWTSLDPHLRWLAVQATSGAIGCPWCIDFGYYEGMQSGFAAQKVRDVPRWRESDVYDDRERAVLAYADAASQTPAAVSEDVVAALREFLNDREIVELAGWVALENQRSRFNAGLGLVSEGFSDACAVPIGA